MTLQASTLAEKGRSAASEDQRAWEGGNTRHRFALMGKPTAAALGSSVARWTVYSQHRGIFDE